MHRGILRRGAGAARQASIPPLGRRRLRRPLSTLERDGQEPEEDDGTFLARYMPRAIDVHTHMYLPCYMRLLRERTEVPRVIAAAAVGALKAKEERLVILPGEDGDATTAAGRPIGDEYWSLDRKLEFMDAHGIAASVISLANPWVDFLPAADALRVAAEVNDEIQAMSERAPGRIYGFGTIAAHVAREDDGSTGAGSGGGNGGSRAVVAELERLKMMSGMRGVILGAHMLDHPGMDPIYDACARLGLVIFLHPHYGVGTPSEMGGYGHVLPLALGFPFETSLAVSRLILSGALDRHPDLTLLLAHAGGTLPFLAGRLDSCVAADPAMAGKLKRAPSEYLRRHFYYDGVIYHEAGLQALLSFLGDGALAHRVVWGTDNPFFPPVEGGRGAAVKWPSAMKNYRILRALGSETLWDWVCRGNAGRLLGIPT